MYNFNYNLHHCILNMKNCLFCPSFFARFSIIFMFSNELIVFRWIKDID